MSKPTTARPTEERIAALDTLRGFAIFGILVVNILLFGTPYDVYDGVWTQPLDLVAAGFMLAFAEGKFYPVFSFLFGLGFMLQMDSAARRGTDFVPFFIRRMLILFGFGLVHALLFSHFDILAVYALLGLGLLALRNAPNPVLLGLALFSLALPFGVRLLGGLDYAALGFTGYSDAERLAIYQQGSFASIFVARLTDLAEYYLSVIEVSAGKIFAMFLLGAWVGRQGYLQYPAQHRRLLVGVLWGGAIIGISGGLIYAVTTLSGWEAESRLFSLVLRLYLAASDLALAGFYIAGVTLLCQPAAWRQRLAPLADVGRMALTNYISQSVLATTLFYGYGLGLFGQFGPAALLAMAGVIFALQVICSRWWLQHFRMGPLEWLWRSLSYGKTTPLRRVVI